MLSDHDSDTDESTNARFSSEDLQRLNQHDCISDKVQCNRRVAIVYSVNAFPLDHN